MRHVNYEAMTNPETYVPPHMRDGFKLWIEQAIPPGSYGQAVLSNDLKAACAKADIVNRHHIFSTVSWLWNYAPSGSWGCIDAVSTWKGLLSYNTENKEIAR